ncbi:MAG: efflux RND transporter periplasmic adaptor subunit [Ferruginibacter sp.]
MKNYLSILTVLLLLTSCATKKKTVVESGTKYTCSMHPQIMKDEPGKCPICHMDLIPVQTIHTDSVAMRSDDIMKMDMDSSMQEGEMNMVSDLELSEQQIRLGNIKVDTIGKTGFGNSVVLTGTIAFNEKNIETVSARVRGRIERLYYKNVGDYVPTGAKIYELYSEQLNSAKQEYILLLQQRKSIGKSVINYNQLLSSARHKLLLWGMTAGQVNALTANGRAAYVTAFYSPAGGYITQSNGTEGAYVMEGQSIMRLANTSTVWVETQAYSSQLAGINRNASVTVQVPQLGDKKLEGKIEFASPEINQRTRINLLRVSIPNPGNQLKPGMPAYIYVNGTVENDAIALPANAVMHTNKTAFVWVQTGANKFSMQTVVTGAENGNEIEIKQGLKPNSAVVVSGAYLLNSEYLLRNGSSSMEGMKM